MFKTVDDATWLYKEGNVIKDIYGNDGSADYPYRITSASQLLSFAKEVSNEKEPFTGALAGANNGIIGGCKVIDDVSLATGAGALVGSNSSTGVIHACYYTGTGNLIGTDSGTTKGCYTASDIPSFTDSALKTFVSNLNTALSALYNDDKYKSLTKFQFVHNSASYPTVTKVSTNN